MLPFYPTSLYEVTEGNVEIFSATFMLVEHVFFFLHLSNCYMQTSLTWHCVFKSFAANTITHVGIIKQICTLKLAVTHFTRDVGSIIWGRWLKGKERCKNMDAPSCISVKPDPKRGEHQQLTTFCESQFFSFLGVGASSVRIHHTTVAFSLCTTFEAKVSPDFSVVSQRFDVNPYFGGGCWVCL